MNDSGCNYRITIEKIRLTWDYTNSSDTSPRPSQRESN